MPLRVGLVGAGIGGVAAAISLSEHGGSDVEVTILEAASELGEIGAGIQMTPNVSRFLQRWGVADVIGENLVELDEMYLRRRDGTVVGRSRVEARDRTGYPWWLVHRMHLHDGLVTVARRRGAKLVTGARVEKMDYESSSLVTVTTQSGQKYDFDVLIGSDGLNSIVRRSLFPEVKSTPPTTYAAYRAIVPWQDVYNDPITKPLAMKNEIHVWMSGKKGTKKGYVIAYPISGGKDFNMVLSHHAGRFVYQAEEGDMDELREIYEDYDPGLVRIISKIKGTVKRWPLLYTRCPSWSSSKKNVVLMGDAAHSMVNHMAQGAATSMEDGAFLGVILAQVAKGTLSLSTAISAYERERQPLADHKQQISFLNGAIWHMDEDSEDAKWRDEALKPELEGKIVVKSPNLHGGDALTWRMVYDYDAEAHAKETVRRLLKGEEKRDATTGVQTAWADAYMNWYLPRGSEASKARL